MPAGTKQVSDSVEPSGNLTLVGGVPERAGPAENNSEEQRIRTPESVSASQPLPHFGAITRLGNENMIPI